MTGKVWQILIATFLGVVLLVGLGLWQLQRLQWKEALIAERDSRLAAAPVSLDQALKEFERCVRLTLQCQTALQEAEQKVEILLKKTETAEPVPFTAPDPD
jgi:exodeoxyribonuclease VII small subunit